MAAFESLLAALADPVVTEVMINNDGFMYVEKPGAALEQVPGQANAQDVHQFLSKLVGPPGTFGPQRPYADLLALDGSRVHVLAPPLVAGGLCVTVRKRPPRRPDLKELVELGTMTLGVARFLAYAVEHKQNILIVGGTSSGKTTLLNALAARIDPAERILILEDTPELTLPLPHVMYLRTFLRDAAGARDVTLAELLINTLRMRPDRIIVGEVRGGEAADMLQAMNVGHEGTLCSLHANSCREGLHRLEALVLTGGVDMPLRAVRSSIAQAIDLIVFVARFADGSRRVMQVAEVTGLEVEHITMADLFKTDSRKTGDGMMFTLKPTGSRPRFYDQLRQQGLEPPLDFFEGN